MQHKADAHTEAHRKNAQWRTIPGGGLADAKNLSQNNAIGQESRTPQYKAMSAVSQVRPGTD